MLLHRGTRDEGRRDEGRGVGSTGSWPVYRRGISRKTTRLGTSFCRGPRHPWLTLAPLADLCPAHQTQPPHCLRCMHAGHAEAISRPDPVPSDTRRDIHAPSTQIAEPTGSRRNDAPTVGPAPSWPMGAPQLASLWLLLRSSCASPGPQCPGPAISLLAPGYASEPLAYNPPGGGPDAVLSTPLHHHAEEPCQRRVAYHREFCAPSRGAFGPGCLLAAGGELQPSSARAVTAALCSNSSKADASVGALAAPSLAPRIPGAHRSLRSWPAVC